MTISLPAARNTSEVMKKKSTIANKQDIIDNRMTRRWLANTVMWDDIIWAQIEIRKSNGETTFPNAV